LNWTQDDHAEFYKPDPKAATMEKFKNFTAKMDGHHSQCQIKGGKSFSFEYEQLEHELKVD
jgi:hypothetical protein